MKSWHLFIGLLVLLIGCQTVEGAAVSPASDPLVATGTIQAPEIHVASELGGRIMAVHTAVGDAIEVGDILVELDTTPLLVKISEAKANVAVAEAELALLLAGPNPAEIAAAQANVQLAETKEQGAWTAWQNALLEAENPQALNAQIAEARTQLNLAVQAVELAEAQLQQQQLLRDQKAPGSLERDMADYQVSAAEAALAAAEADQSAAQTLLNWLYVIHNEPLGLVTQANLAGGEHLMYQAETTVTQAELDDLTAGPTPEEIASAESAVALAQAQLDILMAQQHKFTINSLTNGVMLEQEAFPGEVVAPAATILTIADMRQLTLTVFVPENRLGDVMLGQDVLISVSSFPGRLFQGQVTQIGSEPEFTPRNIATVEERLNTFYAVTIQLENFEELLKSGMSAEAIFSSW